MISSPKILEECFFWDTLYQYNVCPQKGLVSKSATYNHTPWKDGAHLRYYPIKISSQSGTVKTNIGGVRIRDTLLGNQLLTSQTDLINAKKD